MKRMRNFIHQNSGELLLELGEIRVEDQDINSEDMREREGHKHKK